MKYGRVSPAVTDRSIIRPLASSVSGPDAYGQTGMASGAVGEILDRRPEMIIAEAVNSLIQSGADLQQDPAEIHLKISVALGPETPEETLKHLMQRCGACIGKHGFTYGNAAAYVSDAVNRPVLTVCAQRQSGVREQGQADGPEQRQTDAREHEQNDGPEPEQIDAWEQEQNDGPEQGQTDAREQRPTDGPELKQTGVLGQKDELHGAKRQDLYMAGYAGLTGTAILAGDLEEELSRHFPGVWLERAKSFDRIFLISGDEEIRKKMPAERAGTLVSYPAQNVAEGGILAALWYFSRRMKCGLDVDLRSIPVRQETIEICERLSIHPYQLYTCGAVLLLADPEDRERLRKLQAAYGESGIPFVRIGSLTEGKAGILRSGDEIRYLEKPQQDALAVLAQRRAGTRQ